MTFHQLHGLLKGLSARYIALKRGNILQCVKIVYQKLVYVELAQK